MNEREERIRRARDHAAVLRGQKVETVVAPCLFPTPTAVARYMVSLADIRPGMKVLEPSAGTGALLDELPEGCEIVAVEIVQGLAQRLSAKYPDALVFCCDFLTLNYGHQYDRVIMNPPFDHGSDIQHISNALGLLKPGGRLAAICADGPRQRLAFEEIAVIYEPLPEGTFAYQGTGVRTAIVVINK